MGRKRQEQKEEILQWMGVVAGLLYFLLLVKWIREGHRNMPRSFSYRRSGDNLAAGADYAEAYWKEHYRQATSVPWSLVEEDFIIATSGGTNNLTHGSVAVLAPFVDKDADGFVSKDELADFLNHFGGVGAPSQAHQLDFSIQKALAHSEAIHREEGKNGKTYPHGCAMQLRWDKKQYAELVNSGSLQFPGRQLFTIEAWVQPARRNKDMVIVSKYNRGKWGQYILKLDELGHVFFHREVAPWGLKSDVKLPVGDFSHVAAVYDGNVSRILINGTVGKEQKEGGQDNNPETPVLVGAMQENGSPIEHFDGAIDEVRLWDTARTPEDIQHFMHVSLSGSEDGLVGLWTFDECAGVKSKDRVGKHDAVMRGGAWVRSPLRMKTYQDSFGCVDSLC